MTDALIDPTKFPTNARLLVDADILLYRCGFAAEKTKYLVTSEEGDGGHEGTVYDSAKEAKVAIENMPVPGYVWSRKIVEPLSNALQNVDTTLDAIMETLQCKDMALFLTGKGNFRDSVAKTRGYKDNRDPAHRPKHYRAIKEHLISKYRANVVNEQEADDAIGQSAYSKAIDTYIIVSNDKDLDQLAGFHYNWVTKQQYFVTEEDATKWFYVQLLCGDPTDNIPGILSEQKAKDTIFPLNSPKECAEKAKELYNKGIGEYWADYIEEIAKLVWIRRGGSNGDNPPFWDHLANE